MHRILLAAAVFLSVGVVKAEQAAVTDLPSPDLPGIWADQITFDSGPQGELVVSRDGSRWRAVIANTESEATKSGNALRFTFAGRGGEFRGALTRGGEIRGFWVQPAPKTGPREQQYASPLTLHRRSRNVWSGTVEPLPRRFTLYLRIFRGPDGTLIGAFRNPELNSTGGASQFHVSQEGDAVVFSAGGTQFHGTLVGKAVLRIEWPDANATVQLKRQTEAGAFSPRPSNEPAYSYKEPPATHDGWRTARAKDVGIDEAAVQGLVEQIIDGDPSARRPSLIHSLLIARRGKLVVEEYFFGFQRDQPHDTRSAGKTFASVMLGACMRRGAAITPATRIYELLASMGPFANADVRKSRIDLAHLMTHTSGLACDDNDDASPGGENRTQTQESQPNWWKYTLDLPMAHDPGSRYAYCSAGMNLVGAALTTGTSTWLPELFDRTIARPLGFGTYYWNLMPSGDGYLGGGAFLRPRDLLKVGQMYLDGGVWNGRRVVNSSWVRESTAPHVQISPATTGLTADEFSNFYGQGEDGYAWHLTHFREGDRVYRVSMATGNGGQLLFVIPELDLAVVFTGGNYGQGGIWSRWGTELVSKHILATIRP